MMKRTLSKIPKEISNQYDKIGGWRSIPAIVGLVALIGVPVAFALGAEAGAVILLSAITIALASTLTHCLVGLVDRERKKRHENVLGNQYCNNLTQGTNSDILAASMSANFSGETRTSQRVPATVVNNTLGLIFPCLK
ncbi:MAG: hypothetical protein AB2990_06885 [Candidatus Symbiodolus clandestinus]